MDYKSQESLSAKHFFLENRMWQKLKSIPRNVLYLLHTKLAPIVTHSSPVSRHCLCKFSKCVWHFLEVSGFHTVSSIYFQYLSYEIEKPKDNWREKDDTNNITNQSSENPLIKSPGLIFPNLRAGRVLIFLIYSTNSLPNLPSHY